MEKDLGIISAEGLSFFSTSNRLISHELKNILAIISETLGLIDELIELSDTGMKLDPGKLRTLSKSVIEEIDRANSIIRSMNSFAHSVDEFITEVDINNTVALIIKISKLNPSSKNVKIHFEETDQLILQTSPFFLGTLIHNAIDFACLCTGPKKKIEISALQSSNVVKIIFSGLEEIKGIFPTSKDEVLAKAISAKIMLNPPTGELLIELSQTIEEDLLKNFAV
jgi:nitrogen fixation/metabolism regulation signal transduction histidine kinase